MVDNLTGRLRKWMRVFMVPGVGGGGGSGMPFHPSQQTTKKGG